MCAPDRLLMLVVLAMLAFSPSIQADETGLLEGEWRLVSRTEVAHAAYAMPAMSYERCLTSEMMIPAQELPGPDCQLLDQQRSEGRFQWHLRCQTQGKAMEVLGEARYAGARMQASVRLISDNMTRISHIRANASVPAAKTGTLIYFSRT